MKPFDRAIIYVFVYLGVLLFCAADGDPEMKVHAIYATIIFAMLLVSENRVSVYKEEADRYKALFVKQSQRLMDFVSKPEQQPEDRRTRIFRHVGQKSGIDKAKSA